jgi:hypothetical protein
VRIESTTCTRKAVSADKLKRESEGYSQNAKTLVCVQVSASQFYKDKNSQKSFMRTSTASAPSIDASYTIFIGGRKAVGVLSPEMKVNFRSKDMETEKGT